MFMRRILTSILTEIGHEVVAEATNGQHAIQLFTNNPIDLILMDITMPEKSGLSALKEIKQIDESVKVIMISAMGQQFFIQDALSSGADDFVVKPFQKDRVQEAVNRVLNKR
ncbi:Chemotaxis protein CheY [Paenibacillus sp. CECT 9249]|nr:Chemotaxis protein CheY [Paenibacillus sp. CECT 9249]